MNTTHIAGRCWGCGIGGLVAGGLLWESLRTFPFSSAGGYVWSDVLTLVVTNSPMPLLGLESLVWFPERLCVRRQADQIILEFEHQGASRYELVATSSLQQPVFWRREFTHTGLEEFGQIISVTNVLTSSPRFFRLRRWR